jgi:hypothetical protein
MTSASSVLPKEAPQLLCYELAPPGAAAKAADAIARVIRRELGVADPARHVLEVTPWSVLSNLKRVTAARGGKFARAVTYSRAATPSPNRASLRAAVTRGECNGTGLPFHVRASRDR